MLSRKPTSRNTNARFKQAVQSPPCLFGALCSALRRKTFFRRFFELLSCLAAGCPRCRVPRTSVIALHNLIPRTAGFVNDITMPRMRAQASPSNLLYLKQIARALHPTFRRVVAACPRCHVPRTSVIALHNLIPRTAEAHLLLRSTEIIPLPRAKPWLLPAGCPCYLIPRTGVIALHGLLRGRRVNCVTRCHSEPPRMRRVEESTAVATK